MNLYKLRVAHRINEYSLPITAMLFTFIERRLMKITLMLATFSRSKFLALHLSIRCYWISSHPASTFALSCQLLPKNNVKLLNLLRFDWAHSTEIMQCQQNSLTTYTTSILRSWNFQLEFGKLNANVFKCEWRKLWNGDCVASLPLWRIV